MAAANQSSIVTKCTRILDILADARRPLGFTEIVERSGFVKSSTHRILSILQGEGLAEFDETGKKYKLGPKLITWARAAWRRSDIQQIAAAELETLCEITNMNVALSIRDDDSVLYLRTIDTIPVRYAAHTGEHAPLHCTAVGKVFLAFMPERTRSRVMDQLRFERFTEHTIQDPDVLKEELKTVRSRGYALSIQEEFLQVMGIGAPIWNAQGDVAAGISLWSLTERTTAADIEAQAPKIMAAAQRISFQLGFEGD